GLTPTEVVAVNRYTHDQELAAHGHDDYQLYRRYAEGILDAIGELPGRDREHGRAVFAALAGSPDADDRADAAICLPSLLEADHEFGLTLFEQLLRDPSVSVRIEATEHLHGVNVATASETLRDQVVERRSELGLTEDEVDHLHHVHLSAERGEGIYRLGE